MDFEKILKESFENSASDIHFMPQKNEILVRTRTSGGLLSHESVGHDEYSVFLQKVKLSAGLNISEKRLPQDGIINDEKFGQLRISTLRGIYGEALTIRLFNSRVLSIEELGLQEDQKKEVENILRKGFSMMVITGETGSGKSTTLKAIVNSLSSDGNKVVSVEDPVELSVPGTLEISLNEMIGLDYERAIFASLRQDPDYIAIGEIRDSKTCEHCIKAALSGHPVITTLHSGNYDLTLMRIKSLTTLSEFASEILSCVINQRLINENGKRKLTASVYIKKGDGVVVI